MICITEHNMIETDVPTLYLQNYKLAVSSSRNNRHGGTCILLHGRYRYKEINLKTFNTPNILECCGIQLEDHNINIICIYRSPNTAAWAYDTFLGKLDELLAKICDKNKKTILCGDFNIDRLSRNARCNEFESLLLTYNLKLTINEPTRLSSGTCLDNFSHNIRGCKSIVLELALSDHTAQILKCPVKERCNLRYWFIERRDYSDENLKKFAEYVSELSFNEVYESQDPNDAFDKFHTLFKLFYDLSFPIIKVRVTASKKPKWISKGIKRCSKRKRELLWKYRLSNCQEDKNKFKNYSKRFKKIVKLTQKSQNDYYIKTSDNKCKATWNIINKNKLNFPAEDIRKIKVGHNTITDPQKIAQAFNDFYIDQIKPITGDKPSIANICSNVNSIFMSPTTSKDINKIIKNLKNKSSTGNDDICTKVIKYVAETISPILSHIMNLCIEQGIFPAKLKTAIIKPMFKKLDKENMTYYRPIALIPIIAKIFEKVIYNCLYSYFEKNNIFAAEQKGFRKNKSINSAIYDFLYEVVTSIDKRIPTVALFMDMTKAFDYVDHSVLIMKLQTYGVRGNVLNLIKSYLSGRKQMTIVSKLCPVQKTLQNYVSDTRMVEYGVPQGSVLGPLLFLIYINDLPRETKNIMVLFADDSTILFKNKNIINLETDINNTLTDVIKWLTANNLLINLDKTNIMTFKNNYRLTSELNNINIKYNNKIINEIKSTKFLGLNIDSHLTWKEHIVKVCMKLNTFSYALHMLSKVVNQKAVLAAYYAYVVSTLRYGLIFWGNSTDKEIAFKAQKRCIRSIRKLKPTDTCKPHFIELKTLTLPSLYILEVATFVKTNYDLFDNFNSERYKNKISAPRRSTALFKKSIFGMAPLVYNHLPTSIREIQVLHLFKKRLSQFLIGKAYYSVNEFLQDKI